MTTIANGTHLSGTRLNGTHHNETRHDGAAHPASYTAYAFLENSNKLQRITVPWRDPGPGEVVVKVLACGVCASDDVCVSQAIPVPLPRVPGHEIVGDVFAVPPTERVWKVGQRVGGAFHAGHCLTCARCRTGDFMTCEHEEVNGITRDGGYAEYITMRSEAVISVPEELDPAMVAPIMCAGVTMFNSLRHMDVMPPETVAVQGIGGLGHLGIQIASAMGFHTVALSSGPAKEALARRLGADDYVDGSVHNHAEALQKLGGAKVIMCTAPSSKAMQGLVAGLSIDGTLLVLPVETNPMTINPFSLVRPRLSIRGWPAGTPKDTEDTLKFVRNKKIQCMVERFPLERAQEAYDHRENALFRAVIIP